MAGEWETIGEVPAGDGWETIGSTPKPRPVMNQMQRFMGKGKQGDTMEKIRSTVDSAGYNVGGAVTDVAAKVLPEKAAAAAGYVANVATETIPAILGGELLKATSPALQHAGKQLMQSALKPTLEQLRTGKAAQAIDTLLKEGVNVTPGGIATLRARISDLNTQIADAIKNSPAAIDKGKVARYLQGTLDKFKKQVNPKSDIAAIQKAWDEFVEHPLLTGKEEIPVKLAQEMKQATYKSLGEKSYGELKGSDTEAQKTLARGLKEEIAGAVPGIADMNKAESELLNALKVTERRVLMDSNKNPMGLGWLAAHPSTWLGFAADRSPLVKSLLARMLNSGAEQIPATAGRAAGAVVGAAEGSP